MARFGSVYLFTTISELCLRNSNELKMARGVRAQADEDSAHNSNLYCSLELYIKLTYRGRVTFNRNSLCNIQANAINYWHNTNHGAMILD